MSGCEEFRGRLEVYRVGEADPAVEAHLASCASCRAALAGIVKIENSLCAAGEHYDELAARTLAAPAVRTERRKRWKEIIPMAIAASTLVALTFFLAQPTPKDDVSLLIEKLRTGTLVERDEAEQKLKGLGPAAVPELEKAAKDPDDEVASRARLVLRCIEIRKSLTADLLKAVPQADDRIGRHGDRAWAEVFAEAWAKREGLGRADFEPLVAQALKGAETPEQKVAICDAVATFGIAGAASGIVRLLEDPEYDVRSRATGTLSGLKAREAIPALMKMVEHDEQPAGRYCAATALAGLGAREAVPSLIKLLGDRQSAGNRANALICLDRLNARDAIPVMLTMLRDDSPNVRAYAATTLADMGVTEAIPDLIRLLADLEGEPRARAANALGVLGAKEAAPEVRKLLDDADGDVRANAVEGLGLLGVRDAAPAFAKLLKDENRDARVMAAAWLSAWGSREGVPVLLAEARGLLFLNALRQPEAWRRMSDKTLTGDLEGTVGDVMARLAADAGLRLDLSPASKDAAWLQEPIRIDSIKGQKTLLYALRQAAYQRCRPILEGERLRIIPDDQVLDFWKAWWQEQKK